MTAQSTAGAAPRAVPVMREADAEEAEKAKRAEFARQAQYFFGHVQKMKDKGDWKPRQDYKRMTDPSLGDGEAADIWAP